MEQSVRNSSLSRFIFLSTVIVLILIPYSFLQAQSPAGWWKFDDGRGNIAADSSGNGRDATLINGATWTRLAGAAAVSANASSRQYVRIPALDLTSTRALSVTLWVKGTYSESGSQTLVESGGGSARAQAGFALVAHSPTCNGMQAILMGSSGETANCYGALSPGAWHHLAAVYDKTQTAGDAVALYVDGVLQTPGWNLSSAPNTDGFGDDPVYLFSRQGRAEFSSGAVRELRIYGEALNAQQVQMDYRGILPGSPSQAQINYVQGNSATPQSRRVTTVAVRYTAAQQAGDLNVVAVGWNDSTATVSSVVDSKGNVYARAVGPTIQSGYATQSIYYAKNIVAAVAGANTVTVTFSTGANSPDIRIAEYSGADANNPVDVTAASSGTGTTSSSGSVTTTNATDLIFGANLVQTMTSMPGSGFTKRMITQPDGDILEDRMVTSTGSYSATASIWPSGKWIMQLVAFRTPNGPVLTSIAVTPTNPSITVGGYQQFTATGTYSDGSHQDLTNSATWSSSAPQVATITSTGLATGVSAGSTTIKAASGSIYGSTTLTVTAAPDFTISASPTSLTVQQGNRGVSTITIAISNGFNSAIVLSTSGVPSGTSVSFNPSTIPAPGNGTSTMTITVGSGTAPGIYPITVAGTGGGIQRTTEVGLTVTGMSGGGISYVQGAYLTPQSPQSSVSVIFAGAQYAGDLNVVVVGWNDSTAVVSSVHDSKGNTYALAVGPTVLNGVATQSIYYAKNIVSAASGTNTVTVSFSQAASYPDVRIAEYNGADPNNPVDVTSGASGNSSSSNSGAATTTNATDLIFGANLVQTLTTGPGSGFTQRMLTSPDGDIAEDSMVSSTGSYSATAPLSPPAAWIMQMVAFRTPGASGNFSLSASPSSLTIAQGSYGTSTITAALTNGFNSSITLSASGLPTGATASFSPNPIPAPGSGTSTVTITVSATTPSGTYPVTITGNGGGIQRTTTVTLTVSGGPTFTVSASPSSLSLMHQSQGYSTITVAISNGFNNSVSLSASGVPSGTTVTFNPATLPAPGSGNSTMTISVGNTLTGTYPIVVTATGGGIYQTTTVNLTVDAQMMLTWTASESPGIAGYNVYRGTTSGGPYNKINSNLVPTTNYNDVGVQDGGTYYYVTTAVDDQGQESGYSNESSGYIP